MLLEIKFKKKKHNICKISHSDSCAVVTIYCLLVQNGPMENLLKPNGHEFTFKKRERPDPKGTRAQSDTF